MRHLSIAAIAAASMVAFTPVALADSPPPVFSWTGFYIGVNIGGGWGDRDVNYTPNDLLAYFLFLYGAEPPPASFRSSGVIGGIQLGYNWQFNNRWLVGFETDFDLSGMKGSASTSGAYVPYFTAPFSAPVEERIKWFGTVRARLGYLPMDNLLLYATGGFAYGRVERSGSWISSYGFAISNGNTSVVCRSNLTCFAGSSSDTASGWTIGGGIEYALWQKWTLKAEYLYVKLNSESVVTESALVVSPGESPASFNANFNRANFNVVRVGVNYHF